MGSRAIIFYGIVVNTYNISQIEKEFQDFLEDDRDGEFEDGDVVAKTLFFSDEDLFAIYHAKSRKWIGYHEVITFPNDERDMRDSIKRFCDGLSFPWR